MANAYSNNPYATQDFATPVLKGYELGSLIRQRRRDAELNKILSSAYHGPTPETTKMVPGTSGSEYDEGLPVKVPAQAGGLNIQNALAAMYQGGFGKEALGLQQQHEQNEIANLLKQAQIAKALRPEPLKAPTTRQVPINADGDTRTEEWDATTGTWKEVAVGRKSPLVQNTIGGDKGFFEADKKFVPEHIEWKTGGFADAQKGISQIRHALSRLKNSDTALTGPLVGNLPDVGLQFVNPEAIAVRETIEEVVQRNLRLILGAQFTEKEGERLIARAYNPRLSPQENIMRVERLIMQMEKAARAKQEMSDYFDQHGTIKGFKGQTEFSIDDFMPEDVPESGAIGQDGPSGKPNLQPGKTIEDGYIYMGGDPSKPESWKKLR